jgi:uncharacterized protein YdiU (UPF0061 family)
MRNFKIFHKGALSCQLALLLLALLVACSKELSPTEQAMEAVKENYTNLFDGRYEAFLKGRVGIDSIPDSYREELLTSYKQFVIQQKQAHGGINSFVVTNAKADSTLNIMQVFLTINYADSMKEEIVVPMVEHNGEWKMK